MTTHVHRDLYNFLDIELAQSSMAGIALGKKRTWSTWSRIRFAGATCDLRLTILKAVSRMSSVLFPKVVEEVPCYSSSATSAVRNQRNQHIYERI